LLDLLDIQDLFADGNNFNLPTPKIVNAFEAGDSRKAVTILDMVACGLLKIRNYLHETKSGYRLF
jgi:hypothetical protein